MHNIAPSGIFLIDMRDIEIRHSLRQHLTESFGNDPSTLILDELGVCRGTARVDMAVINGELKGFEIKSDRDTLERLEAQASVYNKVFDTLTVVVEARHVPKLEAIVPKWWGILVADRRNIDCVEFSPVRSESINSEIDPQFLVQLLWREEALALLEVSGIASGLRSKPRRYLWEAVARNLAVDDLRNKVRNQLRTRQRWRSDR